MKRSRAACTALLLATVALGLASRRFGAALPEVLARYGGDVLWAAMVVWLVVLVRPGAATVRAVLAAFGIAVTVELSQLVRVPWLESLRGTRPGALLLGQGFLWSDLACYAIGVTIAGLLDWRLFRFEGAAISHGTAGHR